MVELEDETDVPRPPAGQPPFRHGRNQLVAHPDFALAGRVESGNQVQERGLAGAARPHQAEKLTLRHVERHAVEHVQSLAAAAEELVDSLDANDQAVVGCTIHVRVKFGARDWGLEFADQGSFLIPNL